MSYKLIRWFLVLFLIIGLVAIQAPQTVRAAGPWYVSPAGNDGNDCQSPTSTCATINGAIGKATSGDTILVSIGTYTGSGEQVVLIEKNVTLSGGWDASFTTQSGMSTIDGEGTRRGITVNNGVTVIIEHFVIQNGYNFSGIHNLGTLTLTNSKVSDNTAHGTLGISNRGTLILNNSVVSGNTDGGIYNGFDGVGNLTLNNSTISGNSGDGGVINMSGSVTLNNSLITDNQYQGINNHDLMVISNSIVSSNRNGIFNRGIATLNNSAVRFNIGTYGGGIYNTLGTILLIDSTVTGNTGDKGGGIYNDKGTVTLDNSTVSSNKNHGSLFSQEGGGVYNINNGVVTLNNSTVSGNTSYNGGGIYNAGSTVTLRNSILAGNTSSGAGPDCSGTLSSQGYNLVQNTIGCTIGGDTTGNLTGVDPLLGPLQDNGGPTFTHALLGVSPAIDAGNSAGCTDHDGNPLTIDQRGVARPQGVACDIGAFELELVNLEVDIDIKPESFPNRLNLKSEGVLPVAILTTDTFDASTVDRSTVLFGVTGVEASPVHSALSDVDHDGDMDVIFHFKVKDTGFVVGDNLAYLTGVLIGGEAIKGSDSINIIKIPTK